MWCRTTTVHLVILMWIISCKIGWVFAVNCMISSTVMYRLVVMCNVEHIVTNHTEIQLYLNVHRKFGRDLVKSSGYTMIFILVYAESFKSIGMLAYRASFCCCRSKVCSDAFVKKIHQVSYNMGVCWNHNVWQQIGYKQYILIIFFKFFACT